MIHPDTELLYINNCVGYGVFATKFIPQGTITWVLDELDQKFDETYVNSLDNVLRQKLLKYCYRDRDGKYILCWDIAKFVNHSFNSNCISTPYKFEIAIRDIYPGEQLTDDYGYLNLDEPFYCLPEQGCSRTKVMPDDILRFYPEWDQKAGTAMEYFNSVEQPLRRLISSQYVDKVNAIAQGKAKIDSILNCYYDRANKPEYSQLGVSAIVNDLKALC